MSDELVTVYVAGAQWEAQLVKGYLEEEGIRSHLAGEPTGPLFGAASIGSLAEVRVQVLAEDLEKACRIVDEYRAQQAEKAEPGDSTD